MYKFKKKILHLGYGKSFMAGSIVPSSFSAVSIKELLADGIIEKVKEESSNDPEEKPIKTTRGRPKKGGE